VILVVLLFFPSAHSSSAQYPLNRALLPYERKDFEGALQETDRVIQQIPNYSRAYTLRGQIKKERRDFDGAMADFNKALELNPNDGLASYQRGVIRLERGYNDGAMFALQPIRGLVIKSRPWNVWRLLSRISPTAVGGIAISL
jgi:tetratricopeptide (TPR) repeat protein